MNEDAIFQQPIKLMISTGTQPLGLPIKAVQLK